MRAKLPKYLAVPALAFALAGPLAAQEEEPRGFYRIEAIVFTHAGGQSDAWPVREPAAHAQAVDPRWQAFGREQERERIRSETDSGDSELAAALDVVDAIANLESGETSLTRALLLPEPWLALEELSDPMAQAVERLQRSGAYRLQSSLAWYQPLDEGRRSRAVRIHDSMPVAVDWIRPTPTGRLLRDGRIVSGASDLAPTFHYRLDGSIRIRQRQFMHADVTIDWRVPATIGPSPWAMPGEETELAVHRLEQSRTIRPGRFEYFDSPWLGLLLRVTPYEIEPVKEQSSAGESDQ